MVTPISMRVVLDREEHLFSLIEEKGGNTPLFSFLEYERCQVELLSDEPEATLELEYMNEDGNVSIHPYQPFILSEGNDDDQGFIPGIFTIRYKSKKSRWEGFFQVKPQSLQHEELSQMRELLESKATGITRNVYSKKLSSTDEVFSKNTLDSLTFLIQHFDELMKSLNQVLKHPIEELDQDYQITPKNRKPTAKSQRWDVTKGQRYKLGQVQQVFYAPKRFVNQNNRENQSLKHMLMMISSHLIYLHQQYSNTIDLLSSQIEILKEDVRLISEHQSSLKDSFNLKKQRGSLGNELRIRTMELENMEIKLKNQLQYSRQIHLMNAQLMTILNESWMTQITPLFKGIVSQRFLKTPSYSFIYQIYQQLNKRQEEGEHNPTFPYYRTSKLFEYYNVLLLIELIQKQGFNWISGWLKDFHLVEKQTFSLNSEEEMIFNHENGYRLRLSYDKFLKESAIAKLNQKEQLVSVNSNSRRPDILLELYEGTEFLSAMIVEVKYRKIYNLFHKVHETDAMKQLVDYRALNYYNPNKRPMMQRNAVDTIITIYPNHENSRFVHDETYGFKFIPVSPIGFTTENTGVVYVESALQEFLETYMAQ